MQMQSKTHKINVFKKFEELLSFFRTFTPLNLPHPIPQFPRNFSLIRSLAEVESHCLKLI